jgi:hypothetical protein
MNLDGIPLSGIEIVGNAVSRKYLIFYGEKIGRNNADGVVFHLIPL